MSSWNAGPHEEERDEGHGVRHRVEREWQQATDPEERAAQGLADEIGSLHTCLVLSDGSRQLLLRDDLRQRGGLLAEALEEDEERAFDECDDHDLRERERSEREDERGPPSASARPASAMSMTRLRFQRSTRAPAGR